MTNSQSQPYALFGGFRRLASGTLPEIAVAYRAAVDANADGPLLIFYNQTGRSIDVDTRGTDAEITARYSPPAEPPRGRGRPKLGVVPREVTLLPRHWEWLSTQPGGASVTLRKLVEEARRAGGEKDRRRHAHEAAYHFMLAMAGDLPGFEEATRALFAGDHARFGELVREWPHDVRTHATHLAFSHSAQETA